MNLDSLDFEQPIDELNEKIKELQQVDRTGELNIEEEVNRLKAKAQTLTRDIFQHLTDPQIIALSRHPKRPHTIDYIDMIFSEFNELHGDRHGDQAPSIITGITYLEQQAVVVIGQEKGRTTKEKVARNFGMSSPSAFRKALRVMKLAEKFNLPVITFIDTPGAYPGSDAEKNNQSEAIARNLYEMSTLKTPIISIITGEGCSGGALGIGVSDYLIMLEFSYFSVISPQACASIIWKNSTKSSEAIEAMSITPKHLLKMKIIDEILEEPLGGAHRDSKAMANTIQKSLSQHINRLKEIPIDTLIENRLKKLMSIGIEGK